LQSIFFKYKVGGFETDHFITGENYSLNDTEYTLIQIKQDICMNTIILTLEEEGETEDRIRANFHIKSDVVFGWIN